MLCPYECFVFYAIENRYSQLITLKATFTCCLLCISNGKAISSGKTLRSYTFGNEECDRLNWPLHYHSLRKRGELVNAKCLEQAARFRTRSDADGHLQRLRQLIPDARFMVVFDCQREEVVI
ncbi:MAG: hypothetical protein RMY34_09745 [Aulosira sp. DedQUE10]|nr:hypothetical protein [Aulosira sp. DedQUE10]